MTEESSSEAWRRTFVTLTPPHLPLYNNYFPREKNKNNCKDEILSATALLLSVSNADDNIDSNEINLIDSDNHKNERQMMIKLYWKELKKNGDHSIYNLDNNPIMKIIEIGPNA